ARRWAPGWRSSRRRRPPPATRPGRRWCGTAAAGDAGAVRTWGFPWRGFRQGDPVAARGGQPGRAPGHGARRARVSASARARGYIARGLPGPAARRVAGTQASTCGRARVGIGFGQQLVQQGVEPGHVLLVVLAGHGAGIAGVDLADLALAVDDDRGRERGHVVQAPQPFGGEFLVGQAAVDDVVADVEEVAEPARALLEVLEAVLLLEGHGDGLHAALLVLPEPRRQELCLVGAVRAPGADHLDDHHLAAVLVVPQRDRAALQVGEAEVQGALAVLEVGQAVGIGQLHLVAAVALELGHVVDAEVDRTLDLAVLDGAADQHRAGAAEVRQPEAVALHH